MKKYHNLSIFLAMILCVMFCCQAVLARDCQDDAARKLLSQSEFVKLIVQENVLRQNRFEEKKDEDDHKKDKERLFRQAFKKESCSSILLVMLLSI